MDTAKFLADLRAQRDRIDNAITALEALSGTATTSAKTTTKAALPATAPTTAKRVISAEARQRMADAQKKRYAKARAAAKKAAAVAPVTTASAKAAPVISPVVKRVGKPMSPATKKKLAASAKARWATKKTATA
jgi:hypothetical protein